MKVENLEFSLSLMTPIQRRRWELYFQHHSLKKVAEIEGVKYQTIQDSLHQGVKKANKELKKQIYCL